MDKTQNNEQSPRRLDFFWNMIYMCGLNRSEDLSRLVGLAQSSIHHWWSSDDISLSHILDAAEKLNVRIEFALSKKDDTDSSDPLYISEIIKHMDGNKKFAVRRLEFIDLALRRYNIIKTAWAKAVGINSVTVYQWFAKDDIMWSRVCQLAKAFNLDIHINISSVTQPLPDDRDGGYTIVKMTRNCAYRIADAPKKEQAALKQERKAETKVKNHD